MPPVAAPTKLVLLPDEPAGLISTRTPGAVCFEATLTWRNPEEAVTGDVLPALSETVRASVQDASEPDAVRRIRGELRAFDEDELARALDSLLRSLTSTAALSEAVLETHYVWVCRPRSVPRGVLERLARGLWEAGLEVRFGPCWEPLHDGAEAAVGVRGAGGDIYERLRDAGPWETASRPL